MSLGVSQIDYWRPRSASATSTAPASPAKEGGPGAQYLSYNVFLGLSVLGGFLALDHLYLRSPLTFLAKLIVNILCFGVWWLYDASQAIFNRDVVKVFGLPVPGMGPQGIGAGTLASDVPDRKHLTFLIYGLSLIFGGMFGMDSFIVGDKTSGIVRLISLITIIFAPLAIGWWLYNLFKFFFSTRDVTDKYWEYFGAPAPKEATMSTTEWLVTKFPFLSFILGPAKVAQTVLQVTKDIVLDPKKVLDSPVLTGPLKSVLEPAAAAVKSTSNAVSSVAGTATAAIEAGTEGIKTASKISDAVTESVGPLIKLAESGATSGVPTSGALEAAKSVMSGGGKESSILGIALIGVVGTVAVSGFVLTYLRSMKTNGRSERNDPPPQPGVLRVPDKEKSSSST
jgi:hypothetical protein